mgnify:CR=1 FL=1
MDLLDIFGLRGKNVLVTGAGSGMGKATARLLTELGANVYATVRRKPVDFAVTKQIPCDLGSQAGVDTMLAQTPDELDAIYICHGISNTQGNRNAMQVQLTNFYSFKYITEQLLPRIADNGSVTFISSDGGKAWRENIAACREIIGCKTWESASAWYEAHPDKTAGGYVFAKQCQHVYVMDMCQNEAFISRKIRINAIAPGMTKTGLTDDFNASICGKGTGNSGKAVSRAVERSLGVCRGNGLSDGSCRQPPVQLYERTDPLHRLWHCQHMGNG